MQQLANNGLLFNYMTPEQCAAELAIHRRTLDRWHNQRIGPPRVRVGRKVLYIREAVLDWIASSVEDPAPRKQGRNR